MVVIAVDIVIVSLRKFLFQLSFVILIGMDYYVDLHNIVQAIETNF